MVLYRKGGVTMYSEKIESCNKRLAKALDIRNMKQSELCRLTEIPKSAMSQYVKGSFEPKQDRVYLISKALNVSEAWLMGYDVPMERSDMQKKNDQLVELVTLLRKDNELLDLAHKLSKLTPEQRQSLKPILSAFTQQQLMD
jgi:transcriptional regulator with XRE-family HTH domain